CIRGTVLYAARRCPAAPDDGDTQCRISHALAGGDAVSTARDSLGALVAGDPVQGCDTVAAVDDAARSGRRARRWSRVDTQACSKIRRLWFLPRPAARKISLDCTDRG